MWSWENWSYVADHIGAEFITGGGSGCKLRKRFRKWTITLEFLQQRTYQGTQNHTNFRAAYVRKDSFEFDTLMAGPVLRLVKFFRLNQFPLIKMGSKYIQSDDESKLRAFCANPKILELVQSVYLPTFRLRRGPDLPEGVAEIYGWKMEWPHESFLKSVTELFDETLNQLVVIGSASEEAPNFELWRSALY